jgi:rhodanese-related sulfurtransferase
MFVVGEQQDRHDIVGQCLKIGYENLVGELDGGMAAWREAGLPVTSVSIRQLDDDLGPTPLDVRQDSEWKAGHLPNAQHVELGSVKHAQAGIRSGPLTIYCGHGDRAMTAASLLEAEGRRDLAVLDGGFGAWSQAGRPVTMDL